MDSTSTINYEVNILHLIKHEKKSFTERISKASVLSKLCFANNNNNTCKLNACLPELAETHLTL